MAARQAVSGDAGKRRARRTGAGTAAPHVARRPDRERRFVDVDPWAALLEQLMEVPDGSTSAEREAGKGK